MSLIYIKIDDGKWIQGDKFKIISKSLASNLQIKIINESFALRKMISDKFFTPCMFASWRQVLVNDNWKRLPLKKCIASVSSHYNIGGGLNPISTIGKNDNLEDVHEKAIHVLKQFGSVLVNSLRLYNHLSPYGLNLHYIPNGVDTSFYRPKSFEKMLSKKPIIGWVGKVKGAKNYELVRDVKKVLENIGFEFKEVALKKGDSNILGKEEMKEFYNSIDYYLCTSWHEGTPNPCLEAASCGVPLITTRVGNMPELVKERINGFFIDPNIASVENVLINVKSIKQSEYNKLSNNIRNDIENEWDWSQRGELFSNFFEQHIRLINEQ